MVISCAAAAASAEEKEDDHSELFFQLMDSYIDENEYHSGLGKSSYKLLGDTSNGLHIAYCEYYPGDDIDTDLSFDRNIRLGDYLLSGKANRSAPSQYGIYCFGMGECVSIAEVFHTQVDPPEVVPYWLKSVPYDEIAQIVNKSKTVHIYHKNDLSENDELSIYFKDEMILPFFRDYCGYQNDENSICNVYGKYDKYYIFFGLGDGGSDSQSDEEIYVSRVVGGYVLANINKYYPYDLGIFVFDDEAKKVYTLEDALDAKLFEMSDISDIIDRTDIIDSKPLMWGDATCDGKVDMKDVVFLQKAIAKLYPYKTIFQYEYDKFSADIDFNDIIDMRDVVLVQRMIAGL